MRVSVFLTTFIVSFYFYFTTLSISIPGGDSGELIAESCHLGIAHPPGYPLFILIFHIWIKAGSLIQQESDNFVAWWSNVLSALLNSCAAGLISLTVCDLSEKAMKSNRESLLIISIATGILLALSKLYWLYAVAVEVFCLNNFVVCCILFTLSKLLLALEDSNTKASRRCAYLGAFLSGLGLCNQHTIVLVEIPLILFVLVQVYLKVEQSFTGFLRFLIISGFFFILGLTPYLYLLLIGKHFLKDGSWGNLSSFTGLTHHFLRRDYGTFQLYSGSIASETFKSKIFLYFSNLMYEQSFPLLLITPVIISIYNSVHLSPFIKTSTNRENRDNLGALHQMYIIIVVTFLFSVVVFTYLANLPFHIELHKAINQRFYIQPNILVYLLTGLSLNQVFSHTSLYLNQRLLNLISVLLAVGLSYYIYQQVQRNIDIVDRSDDIYMEQYAKAVLSSVRNNSVLIIHYDQQWTSVRYLMKCTSYLQKQNKTVVAFSAQMMSFDWFGAYHTAYAKLGIKLPALKYQANVPPSGYMPSEGCFTMKQFIDANKKQFKGGIYESGFPSNPNSRDFSLSYKRLSHGLVHRFYTLKAAGSSKSYFKYYKRALEHWKLVDKVLLSPITKNQNSFLLKYDSSTWENTVLTEYLSHLDDFSEELLMSGIQIINKQIILRAIKNLLKSIRLRKTINKKVGQSFENSIRTLMSNETKTNELTINPIMYKNLGTGYHHLLKNIGLYNLSRTDFGKLTSIEKRYKDWRYIPIRRCVKYYETYLENAEEIEEEEVIRNVVKTLAVLVSSEK